MVKIIMLAGVAAIIGTSLMMPETVSAAPATCYRDSGGGYTRQECPSSLNTIEDRCYSSSLQGNYTEVSCDTLASAICSSSQGLLGFPTWYQYLDTKIDISGRCQPVLDGTSSILPIGVAVLDIMLRLAGILAVIFVIVGGIKYIISQGDPDRAKSARNTIINAMVGLAITLVSAPIVRFIGDRFGDRT